MEERRFEAALWRCRRKFILEHHAQLNQILEFGALKLDAFLPLLPFKAALLASHFSKH
jgi:hypothetical protein